MSHSQSNKDIANFYLKRAKEVIEISINYETALTYFNKAVKFTDTIVDCEGNFSGDGMIDANGNFIIDFTGNDCDGDHVGQLLFIKQ